MAASTRPTITNGPAALAKHPEVRTADPVLHSDENVVDWSAFARATRR